MSFDPAISEWGNPPKIARKSTLLICLAHGPYAAAFGGLALRRRAPCGPTAASALRSYCFVGRERPAAGF